MTKTKESKLEQEIEKFMKSKGIWQLARYQAQSSQNGLPDRLYLYKGILLGLELKTDEGKPTKLQLKKIEEINNNGGIGLIVRNVEIVNQLIELIDDYTKILNSYYGIDFISLAQNIRKDLEWWLKEYEY